MGCEEQGCGCEESKGSCQSGCGCEGSCSCESKSMAGMIMNLANEAWMELMKEKMKHAYEKATGDKMNKIAQVGIEACIAYWGNQMKDKSSYDEFEEKLKKAMM